MKRLINLLKPYRLVVGEFQHRAWTQAGALEWAACYPKGWGRAIVLNRRGRFVAERSYK